MHQGLASILTMFLLVSFGTIQAQSVTCEKEDKQQLDVAIFNYLKTHTAVPANSVTLLSKQCVMPYAVAIVHPVKPITDDAVIYLQKVDDQWQVMDMGTSFDDDFLAKLPAQLRHPNE